MKPRLYLATVLDCFSRKVVRYAMADHMRTSLVVDELAMAARNVTFRFGETIFQSDRGSPGGFNRWSQHLYLEVSDGGRTAVVVIDLSRPWNYADHSMMGSP